MALLRGNCYVATEALYHILRTDGYWVPMRMKIGTETHWFLKHSAWGTILDPSRLQFLREPDYTKGKRTAFLTQRPSKRAMALIEEMTWQTQRTGSSIRNTTRSTSRKCASTSTRAKS